MITGNRTEVVAAIWDQIWTTFGLDRLQTAPTLVLALQLVAVVLVTIVIARWAIGRVRAAGRTGRLSADLASQVGRAVALGVYVIGVAIALSLIGLNPTAIAAVLGAATFGISLALQDVTRSIVNGTYLLIERPFRIGDRVRVADAVGRVEEIGVRLTRLRTDAGERLFLPSTLIFSSAIERATTDGVDRRTYRVTGIERPVLEITSAVTTALQGLPAMSIQLPIVDLQSSGPEGTVALVTIEHDHGERIDDLVFSRLRDGFPEATITVNSSVELA